MSKSLICWSCGKPLQLPDGPIGFRTECDHCGVYLHCCRGCTHYCPGKSNDCLIPETDLICDREKFNFCEDYLELGQKRAGGSSVEDATHKLFGEGVEAPEKRSFDDLFE